MHEAAVLLQGLIDIQNGKISRQDAISYISARLRKRAMMRWGSVDEKFRNENGISMQMAHLEYSFTDGESGWGPALMWQDKIVRIYREDPDTFQKLLHESSIE